MILAPQVYFITLVSVYLRGLLMKSGLRIMALPFSEQHHSVHALCSANVSGWQKKVLVRVKGGGFVSEIKGRFEKFT
jgi:hypothetical protein